MGRRLLLLLAIILIALPTATAGAATQTACARSAKTEGTTTSKAKAKKTKKTKKTKAKHKKAKAKPKATRPAATTTTASTSRPAATSPTSTAAPEPVSAPAASAPAACSAPAGATAPAPSAPTTASSTTGSTPPALGLTANTQGWGTHADQRLADVVARSGVHWLREEIDWDVVQHTPLIWDWTRYDSLFTGAARHGTHIMPLLFETPSWAGATPTTIPVDPASFATFTARVVARYGPGGTFWAAHPELDASVAPKYFEIWNEPYYPWFAGGSYDPPRYLALFEAAVAAGRLANPRAKYLLSEESGSGRDLGAGWVPWYQELYALDPNLGRSFDGVAMHPYGDDLTNMSDRHGDQLRRIELVHRAMVAHGDGDKPFYLTELGWPTCPSGDKCVSESGQADLLSRSWAILRDEYPYVRGVFLYRMIDDVGTGDPTDREDWFGLLRRDGTPKPAWAVFQRILAESLAAGD